MKINFPGLPFSMGTVWSLSLLLAGIAAYFTQDRWWPPARNWVGQVIAAQKKQPLLDEHSHAGHDHAEHAARAAASNRLDLSRQAMGNIGLTAEYLQPVVLQTFRRTITVPAIVVERPGRTRIEVSTPMAGVITHVHAVRGEAIHSGALLFEIRITAEELVATQTDYLKTIGDLDVENREIERLQDVTVSGAISQKTLLDRLYSRDKLEVQLAAQKEALRLHGLSDRQIDDIKESRRLLRDLQIVAPIPDAHSHEELRLSRGETLPVAFYNPADEPAVAPQAEAHEEHEPLVLQDVLVHKGETVAEGTTLAVVSDLSELYIEGQAFEQDFDLLSETAARNWHVTAVFDRAGQKIETVDELELLYSANDVDVRSRTLAFYVRLPNSIVREIPSPNGLTFVEWKYRPGQRLQLQVPVEEWTDQIVLPVSAVSQDGAESFVFQQNGNHFDRIAVQVIYRDQSSAVLKNDGSLRLGRIVAQRGGHQMQMALKNKSGGGVDPHAGHQH